MGRVLEARREYEDFIAVDGGTVGPEPGQPLATWFQEPRVGIRLKLMVVFVGEYLFKCITR